MNPGSSRGRMEALSLDWPPKPGSWHGTDLVDAMSALDHGCLPCFWGLKISCLKSPLLVYSSPRCDRLTLRYLCYGRVTPQLKSIPKLDSSFLIGVRL